MPSHPPQTSPGTRGAWPAALARLAGRYDLNDAQVVRMTALLEILSGDPLAPTAIREPRDVLDQHLADSLVALELPQVRGAATILDIGSGAGLPGLPLAIALPAASVTLLDSSSRKAAFIERAIVACQITNARAINERVELWREGRGRIDLVTARAVAAPNVVAEYAAPLLKIGGALVIWRGKPQPEAELAAQAAAEELGLQIMDPLAVRPFAAAMSRYLYVMSKVMETPSRFPRRPGMAVKRPLGRRRTSAP